MTYYMFGIVRTTDFLTAVCEVSYPLIMQSDNLESLIKLGKEYSEAYTHECFLIFNVPIIDDEEEPIGVILNARYLENKDGSSTQ